MTVTGAGSYHEPLAPKAKVTVTGPGSNHEPLAPKAKFTITGAGTYGGTRPDAVPSAGGATGFGVAGGARVTTGAAGGS